MKVLEPELLKTLRLLVIKSNLICCGLQTMRDQIRAINLHGDCLNLQPITSAMVNMLGNRKLDGLIGPLFFLALSSKLPFYDLVCDSSTFQFLNISLQAFLNVHQLP